MLNTKLLFASLLWGSIGFGFFIYGKKQGSWLPMVGGVLMLAISYLVDSALLMSLLSLAVIILMYVLTKLGY